VLEFFHGKIVVFSKNPQPHTSTAPKLFRRAKLGKEAGGPSGDPHAGREGVRPGLQEVLSRAKEGEEAE
jgi:hypothetical protein